MKFTNDVDGDVLRSLQDQGFDFSRAVSIDFNVDFPYWPPSQKALATLENTFGHIEVYEPEDEYEGYVLFQLNDLLTHDLVVSTQEAAAKLMQPYQGVCESWGVLT